MELRNYFEGKITNCAITPIDTTEFRADQEEC